MECCCAWLARANQRILTVRVLGAKGLRNTELGLFRRFGDCSDPYAVVSAGSARMQTAVLQNTLEPQWSEDAWTFALGESDHQVEIEVFDCDFLTPDEPLGKASIRFNQLEAKQKKTCIESLGEGNGQIELEVELRYCDEPTHKEVAKRLAALQDEQATRCGTAKSRLEADAGEVLTVAVSRAGGLQNTDRGLFRRAGDASDPYVVASVGDQQLRTATIDNCLDPVWNSKDFTFKLGAVDKALKLQVFDSDLLTFDDSLGTVQLDVGSLAFSQWHVFTKSLEGGTGEIEFKVRKERQAEERMARAEIARLQLEKEQEEQLQLLKARAKEGSGNVLAVAVLRATGLRNTDRGFFRRAGDCSDPYVVVSVGNRKLRTPTINNDLNPVWSSQWFSFTLGDGHASLDLDVYDSDLLTFDDLLGKASISIENLPAGKWHDFKENLGAGNGEIEFKVRREVQGKDRLQKVESTQQQLGQQQQDELAAAKAEAAKGAGDLLTVSVLGATGLRNTDRGLFRRSGDCSDPYVVVSVGKSWRVRTEVIDNNLNPIWNSKEFSTPMAGFNTPLLLEVFDSDLLTWDDLLGKASVDLGQLATGQWHVLKKSLGDGNGEIELKVRLERQGCRRLQKEDEARRQLETEQEEQRNRDKALATKGAGDLMTVEVIGATGLRNTDRGLFRRSGDCSDPYVTVSNGKQKLRTVTIENDLNPVWNSSFSFPLAAADMTLLFEVWDSDLLTSDDLLGKTSLDAKLLTTGSWHSYKESLGKGDGELEFKVRIERHGMQRLKKAQDARLKLEKQQAEQLSIAKGKASEGAGDVLTVAILQATGLRNTDRGLFRRGGDCSDPYVVVSAGKQKLRTKTIDNCLDPVWDSEWFSFVLGETDKTLELDVFDSDLLITDDMLGKTRLDLAALKAGKWIECKESLGEGNGELEFKVRLERQPVVRVKKADDTRTELEARQQKELQAAKAEAENGAGDILTVAVLGAAGLRNTDRGLFRRSGDCSDPYAVVSVGAQQLRTETIDNNLNPVWNSKDFSFVLEGGDTSFKVEVFDSDFLISDDLLGTATVDLGALAFSEWHPLKRTLGEGNGEVEIKVRLEKQGKTRLEKAQAAREQLEKEQEEQVNRAKAKAAEGAGDVVTVAVVQASGLRNTDQGLFRRAGDCSDPYVVVSAGKQKLRTTIIDNNLNPVWNSEWFVFTLSGGDCSRSLELEVFDSDFLTADELLGKAQIDLEQLAAGQWIQRTESLGDGNGTIEFKLRLEKQPQLRVEKAEDEQMQLRKKRAEELQSAQAKAEEGAGHTVHVVVERATGLQNTDRGLFRRRGDCSDPYAVVTVGSQKLWTETIENDLNPVWNSKECIFAAPGGVEPEVFVQVFDRDFLVPDELLGGIRLDLGTIPTGMWKPVTASLGEGCGEIALKVRVEKQQVARVEKAQRTGDAMHQEQEAAIGDAKAAAAEGAGKVVSVQVLSGHKLPNTESMITKIFGDESDPYVTVTLGKTKLQTKIVWNNPDPVWTGDGEPFTFTTDGRDDCLMLEVWDYDPLSPDDLLGRTSLNVADLREGEWISFRRRLNNQPGEGLGELSFQVRIEPQERHRVEKAVEAGILLAQQQQQERSQQEKDGEEKAAKKDGS